MTLWRPPLWPSVITLLAVALLVKLGFWQLHRAEQKQHLFDDFAAADMSQAQPLAEVLAEQPLQRYQTVSVNGKFAPDRYWLLDNQTYQGRVGYQVIALLQSEQSTSLVPVNIGWVAAPSHRHQLPSVSLPQGQVRVRGYTYQPSDNWLQQQTLVDGTQWPIRIQQLDLSTLSKQLDVPLISAVVLLDENTDWGLPRHWQPQVMPPEKHQAYALQWFSLALACAVVYGALMRRHYRQQKQQEASS